ncbi:MAG: hypothetical protein KDB22_15195 [Planctomycetales bacterium]|nr:hypothetical protein [Planctomycetales bacterium]
MLKKIIATSMLLAIVAGCGESGPKTYKVVGTVSLDGTPVERATVTFIPDDMANGKPAVGQTNAAGEFALTTTQSGDGAVAGAYKVMVTKYNTPDGGANPYGNAPAPSEPAQELTQEEQDKAMEQAYAAGAAEREKAMKAGARAAPAKNELPDKYASVISSGIAFMVQENDDNNITIELKKK